MNSSIPTFRVLLVDDNQTFLNAAVHALTVDPRIEVVGSALSGQEGLEIIAQKRPDLVLMDIAMPGMNGIEATRLIKAQPKAPRVVILTSHDLSHYRTAAKAVGADSLISKADFDSHLFPLLEALLIEQCASSS